MKTTSKSLFTWILVKTIRAIQSEKKNSAYWNQTGVPLQPVMVYFKNGNSQDIQRQSYGFVSTQTQFLH